MLRNRETRFSFASRQDRFKVPRAALPLLRVQENTPPEFEHDQAEQLPSRIWILSRASAFDDMLNRFRFEDFPDSSGGVGCYVRHGIGEFSHPLMNVDLYSGFRSLRDCFRQKVTRHPSQDVLRDTVPCLQPWRDGRDEVEQRTVQEWKACLNRSRHRHFVD